MSARRGIPTEGVQSLLATALANQGHIPRVMLVDQEAFKTAAGDPRMPSIIHAASSQLEITTLRRLRPTKYMFSIRVHALRSEEIDGIHGELERMSETLSWRLGVRLVATGRNIEPSFYWRILTISVPARPGIVFPRPPAPEDTIQFPDGAGGVSRLAYGPADDPTRIIYP